MSTLCKSIGLIGDVHCEHQSLAVVIDELNRRNVETIICTGDIPTGPGDINVCCDLLHAHQIRTIRGNHDRWLMTLPVMTLPLATPPGVVKKKSNRRRKRAETKGVTNGLRTDYSCCQRLRSMEEGVR